jgi:hypothetical protein
MAWMLELDWLLLVAVVWSVLDERIVRSEVVSVQDRLEPYHR